MRDSTFSTPQKMVQWLLTSKQSIKLRSHRIGFLLLKKWYWFVLRNTIRYWFHDVVHQTLGRYSLRHGSWMSKSINIAVVRIYIQGFKLQSMQKRFQSYINMIWWRSGDNWIQKKWEKYSDQAAKTPRILALWCLALLSQYHPALYKDLY